MYQVIGDKGGYGDFSPEQVDSLIEEVKSALEAFLRADRARKLGVELVRNGVWFASHQPSPGIDNALVNWCMNLSDKHTEATEEAETLLEKVSYLFNALDVIENNGYPYDSMYERIPSPTTLCSTI